MRTLVFIPAWNEADAVAAVIADVRRALPEADVLVVDDGSVDATAERAREAGALVASLPFNQGLGAALQTGYLYALREGYDCCAHLDADGQHPAPEVARLLAEIHADRADLVIGSRYRDSAGAAAGPRSGARAGAIPEAQGEALESRTEAVAATTKVQGDAPAGPTGGSSGDAATGGDYRPTLSRRIGISVFRFFLTMATRQRFTDTTSGMRAANRRVMALFSEHYSPDFAEIESLQLAVREGLRVEEVPVRMLERVGGASFLTPLRSAFFIFKGLIVLLVGQFRPRAGATGSVGRRHDQPGNSGREPKEWDEGRDIGRHGHGEPVPLAKGSGEKQ